MVLAVVRTDVVRTAVVANLGLLLMVVVWGTMFPAIERILASWDVLSATAGRHTVALLGLLAAMYGNLIPVVAAVIAVWAGTPPTPAQLVGGAIIIAGVLYAQTMALRRQP